MQVIAAGLTDTGRQREYNEDSLLLVDEQGLYIVADGMGGHRAGNVASKMATEAVKTFFEEMSAEESTWPFNYETHLSAEENRLLTSIKLANKRIFDTSCSDRDLYGMGTTIVGALFSKNRSRLYVAHVGDSRAYRIRNNEILLMTRDHSLVNDYLTIMPHLTKEQQDELPRNVITRALGMQESVLVDMQSDTPQEGDYFLLCTDGLSGMLSDEQICDIVLAAKDPEAAAKDLIDGANDRGGEDNVTALVFAIEPDKK
ncbi:MAG: Stp1/IreP family PP2C-type Ser/Thr phosphatase [Myxococcales bacterium]|nr:MAG: Stp1/IreP family PP2C-type Ser/Thr phosphatase [Myxococcales bacterium]